MESTSNYGPFPLLNPTRWENSPRCVLIILKRQRVGAPGSTRADPHARAAFRESIATGEVRSNLPSRLVLFGALMPIARLHYHGSLRVGGL